MTKVGTLEFSIFGTVLEVPFGPIHYINPKA